MILSLWIGVYPKPFLDYIDKPVNAVVRQVRPNYPIPGMPPATVQQRKRDAPKVIMMSDDFDCRLEMALVPATD